MKVEAPNLGQCAIAYGEVERQDQMQQVDLSSASCVHDRTCVLGRVALLLSQNRRHRASETATPLVPLHEDSAAVLDKVGMLTTAFDSFGCGCLFGFVS